MAEKKTYADKIWLKSYKLGQFKLKKTLEPYPEMPIHKFLDDTIAKFPERPAILYKGRKITYKQLKRDVDKFARTGLTPEKAQHVRSPLIKECLSYLECRLQEEFPTGDHQLMVGEVLAAYARPGVLAADGLYDLARAHPLFHIGRDRFTTLSDQSIEPLIED